MLTQRVMYTLLIVPIFFLTACQSSDQNATSNGASATPDSQTQTETQPAQPPMAAQAANGGDADCTLTMGWDPWEPYHFEASDGATRGMDVDFAKAMAERAGCQIVFEKGEWASLLKAMQSGEIDLLAGATKVEQREPFAWFSVPYRAESFQLHVATNAEVQGDDLPGLIQTGFRLGLTEGYIYGDVISTLQDNPITAAQIIYSPIAEYHFNNLAEGRIDGFLEDPYVAEAIARRHGWQDQIKALPILFGNHEVRFMFNRNTVSEALLDQMNLALMEMKQSGLSAEIMGRYLSRTDPVTMR